MSTKDLPIRDCVPEKILHTRLQQHVVQHKPRGLMRLKNIKYQQNMPFSLLMSADMIPIEYAFPQVCGGVVELSMLDGKKLCQENSCNEVPP